MLMRRILIALTLCLCFAAAGVRAAHTQVQLLLSAETARPGDTVWAGVDLKMEPDWHTYWKNPGVAGIATDIKWELPPGVTAGEIQWPLPKKMSAGTIDFYGYADETVLLVPLTLATNLTPGPLDLKANVSWLECKEQCIPGSDSVAATLNIGSETKISAEAETIESWKSKLPKSGDAITASAWWDKPAVDKERSLAIEVPAPAKAQVDFFPVAYDNFDIAPETKSLADESGHVQLLKSVKKYDGDWPKEVSGVIIIETNGNREGYAVKLSVGDQAPTNAAISAPTLLANNAGDLPAPPPQPLWKMLLYAFIGGLILNIMPCVLPVIALKILGFVSESGSSPRRLRALGGIYAVGVLLSFVVLATIVIAIKAAGNLAGWGMQFGNPIFLVCLTTLVTLVALNLFGLFEVAIGGRALDTAGNLAAKHGASGAFFNGVLATVLATPCTAPILGTALGFAFAQSAVVIVLIFLTVGLGLAAPYVVLCWNPNWLKFLPKPGAWMEKFKIAMGFPMLATAVWLLNIAASTYGKNVLWLGLFLVIVAFAAWIFGEFVQRGRQRKGIALVIVLALLFGGYAGALENKLHWREPFVANSTTGSLKESADGIDWQPWSPEAVAAARAAGKPVLVDFTADWCLTCQVNKNTSIEIPSVRAKLAEIGAVALIGDYTHTPASITAELNRYYRAGVPLVLIFPKETNALPIVLPEVLTPNIMLNALNQAAQ
jgi:thiol:disulfide interchange protein DsbD